MAANCRKDLCRNKALSLVNYCWDHLADKASYILLLEGHNKNGNSMENFNLKGVSAPAVNLIRSHLKNSDLSGASLKKADLAGANLSGSDLTGSDLSGCDLAGADCSGANFNMADLSGSRLWHTDMTNADLSDSNLRGADCLDAILFNTRIHNANLDQARQLKKENFTGRGYREMVDEKGVMSARESYANLRKYFLSAGRYNDASWASFNENRMEVRRLWSDKRPGIFPFFLMGLLCGWGERPLRATVAALSIIVLYAAVFFAFKGITPTFSSAYRPSFLDHIYYSMITFTTVGYGDFMPKAHPVFRLMAGSEAFVGIFMMGLFVFSLGRRFSSR